MRKSLLDQLPLVPAVIDHPFARELAVISAVLDQLPRATELVHEALSWRGGKRVDPPSDGQLTTLGLRASARSHHGQSQEEFGVAFTDHTRRAKRRWYKIANSKSAEQRKPLYRDLIKITEKTVQQAQQAADELRSVVPDNIAQSARLSSLVGELQQYGGLANQVLSQAERRVMRCEPGAIASATRQCPPVRRLFLSSNRTPTSSSRTGSASRTTATRFASPPGHRAWSWISSSKTAIQQTSRLR